MINLSWIVASMHFCIFFFPLYKVVIFTSSGNIGWFMVVTSNFLRINRVIDSYNSGDHLFVFAHNFHKF